MPPHISSKIAAKEGGWVNGYVALIIAGILACIVLAYKPEEARRVADYSIETVAATFYDKKINYQGLNKLNQEDVEAMLPLGSSWAWWLTNTNALEVELERSPLIKAATVTRCGATSVRCFNVEIEERTPGMLAVIGERVWMVGRDGAFITPVPGKVSKAADKSGLWSRRFYSEEWKMLPLVDGVFFEKSSPEIVKARVRYVKEALDLLEDKTGLVLEGAMVRESGELVVKFDSLHFQVVFDAGSEANDKDRLGEESLRLKRILEEFKGREEQISLIDLGFDKLAVVRVPGLEKLVDKTPVHKK